MVSENDEKIYKHITLTLEMEKQYKPLKIYCVRNNLSIGHFILDSALEKIKA